MSVAISWARKVQLAKCDIMVGFPKSSHILYITIVKLLVLAQFYKAINFLVDSYY